MFNVIMLSSTLSWDEVTYVIDEEPKTVKFCVTINDPDIV